MKNKWSYIQVLAVMILMIFLLGFAQNRHKNRNIGDIQIEYTNEKDVFITKKDVDNLLIVKSQPYRNKAKDSLVLNDLERILNQNPMIAKAEVFQTLNRNLGIRITQREPLGRVLGAESYYIDKQGSKMPLSHNFSARVPMVTGVDSTDLGDVFQLLQQINQDEFLTKTITSIHKNEEKDFVFSLRETPLKVNFGGMEELDKKLMNFKAFYKKAYQDELLNKYSTVNLKFTNQVVCTKKQA